MTHVRRMCGRTGSPPAPGRRTNMVSPPRSALLGNAGLADRAGMTLIMFSCLVASAVGVAPFGAPLCAQDKAPAAAKQTVPRGRLAHFRSTNFSICTDLTELEAQRLLARAEATLNHIASYWGRPCRRVIKCYVVHDLMNWPDGELPHPLAKVIIGGIGGATLPDLELSERGLSHTALVLAADRPGITEHEIVHAYCIQTFSGMGPAWYKEGMAEMAYHGIDGAKAIRYSADQLAVLRRGKPRSIDEVVNGGDLTGDIAESLATMLSERATSGNADYNVAVERWKATDAQAFKQARESYLWSWALCHLLCHNPNYSERFRRLGHSYLTQGQDSFEEVFRDHRQRIDFEYRFFIERCGEGYRADLCGWDWSKKFRPLGGGRSISVKIDAARGYQASGVEVTAGREYAYRTRGTWATSPDIPATDADGGSGNRGRLVGVLMNGYQLSKSFPLGKQGTFKAPSNGRLYLRCQDAWNELGDNQGNVSVRLQSL